ncbi:hypothetical protein GCM10028807_23830 [Spirosoma daeguense]
MALNKTDEKNENDARLSQQVVYQISGFDRPRFVSDVTNAVPQKKSCHITGVSFEGDGVQVNGQLVVQVGDQQLLAYIESQLRSVQGLVSVKQKTSRQAELSVQKSTINPYARTFFLLWGVLVLTLIGLRTSTTSEKNNVAPKNAQSNTLAHNDLGTVHLCNSIE